jgi:hypothetical protein
LIIQATARISRGYFIQRLVSISEKRDKKYADSRACLISQRILELLSPDAVTVKVFQLEGPVPLSNRHTLPTILYSTPQQTDGLAGNF